jgi:radical SAM protein with 4Fe4S-binding SPASM domain
MTDKFRIDSHKLQFHPARVEEWRQGKDLWETAKSIYPIYVEVSPVGACNHRCTFCAVDYLGYKPISLEASMLVDRLEEMSSLGVKSIMLAGEGEPLLHKKINHIVFGALNARLDVAFTTNGVLLDKLEALPQCSWVKVSVNAGSRETYTNVHKADPKDWDKVWRNIREAAKYKGKCTLGIQMVVLPENAHEIPLLEELAADAGVDYCVIKPYSQHKRSINKLDPTWKPVALQISRSKTVFREAAFSTTGPTYTKCNATPFFWAYITAAGDVYSCSAYIGDPRFCLGNIKSDIFEDIWEGPDRQRNWELLTKYLDISKCRTNCRMDKANRYLNDFSELPHVNFI